MPFYDKLDPTKLAKQGWKEAKGVGNNIRPDRIAQQAADIVKKEVVDEIPHLLESALSEAIKAAQSGVLKQAVKVLDVAAPDSVSLTIVPVGINGINVRQKISRVKYYANHPPGKKSEIKQLVKDLAPEGVSITLSAELALVIVSSSSLSLGMTLDYSTSDFIDRIDNIINAL